MKKNAILLTLLCVILIGIGSATLMYNKSSDIDTSDNSAITSESDSDDDSDDIEELAETEQEKAEQSNIEAPVFSVSSGFYEDAFDLEITSEYTIYYTTNGGDPRTSSAATVYDGAIKIYDNTSEMNLLSAATNITLDEYHEPSKSVDKGMIIRAVAVDENGNYSDVVTNSYFVGKTEDYYYSMKVISLVTDTTNLFDADTGIYVIGNGYYEWLESDEYESYSSGDVQNPTNYNQKGIEWERECTVQVFENGELAYSEDVGMRIAGNWTRCASQKSIRLYARSNYGASKMHYEWIDGLTDINGDVIDVFDKITLRNSGNDNGYAYIRDQLNQELAEGLDLSVQGMEYCIVFLDGEFWGIYTITERMDEDYFESHYGVDSSDITYIKSFDGDGDEDIIDEYTEFMIWAETADMTVEENYQKVCDTIDIQSFMDYIAYETYICNADWSTTTYLNNWEVWRSNTIDESNPYADGKWRYAVYDTEYSTGLYGGGNSVASYNALANMYTGDDYDYSFSTVFYNLLDNDEFRSAFYDTYVNMIENNFNIETVVEHFEAYITDESWYNAVEDTYKRFYYHTWRVSHGSTQLESCLTSVLEFFDNRSSYALKYLDELMANWG